MTRAEFQDALDVIGWWPREMSRRMGIDSREVRRWAAGTKPVPPEIAAWLQRAVAVFLDMPKMPLARGAWPELAACAEPISQSAMEPGDADPG